MNKVAQVTLYFWIIKICATTLGETAGDLLSMTLHVGYAISSLILASLFLVSLVAQLRSDKFHPALYWSVILTTSMAGTTMSDYMDRTIGIGYAMGSLILASILAIVLMVWHYNEKTISVSTIQTTKAEVFYWIAILISNTLGTAFGDYLADNSGLGFLGGATLVGGCIALTAVAARYTPVNRVVLFWLAFVLTRPFGATFGDFLTKPIEQDGLGFGTLVSSAILAILLIMFVIYTSYKKPATPAH
jgi:uncharacterized membrane-anchored protein